MEELRFLVDEMHGKLSVWLRLLGFDATYSQDYEAKYGKSVPDKHLIEEALATGRVLVTADKQMSEIIAMKAEKQGKRLVYRGQAVPHVVRVRQDKPVRQLVALAQQLPLTYALDFDRSRCTMCNGTMEKVGREAVQGKVEPGVYATVAEFYHCPACGHVFWIGGQTKNILATFAELQEALEAVNSGAPAEA